MNTVVIFVNLKTRLTQRGIYIFPNFDALKCCQEPHKHLRSGALKAVIRRCFVRKVFSEIPQNSQENTCANVSFKIEFRPKTTFICLFYRMLLWLISKNIFWWERISDALNLKKSLSTLETEIGNPCIFPWKAFYFNYFSFILIPNDRNSSHEMSNLHNFSQSV